MFKLITIYTESSNEESIRNCYSSTDYIPQCSTCKYWSRFNNSDRGPCAGLPGHDYTWTDFDFFCGLWEPKV